MVHVHGGPTIIIQYCMIMVGADELFGGYLYFYKAPNAQEFHAENVA